jgi:hypothetical protein
VISLVRVQVMRLLSPRRHGVQSILVACTGQPLATGEIPPKEVGRMPQVSRDNFSYPTHNTSYGLCLSCATDDNKPDMYQGHLKP